MARRNVAHRASNNKLVIPVVAEEIKVGKRTVESGRVRVSKHVEVREHIIDQPLLKEEVDVQRVPINRPLQKPASIRTQGDVTIIPVMEEVLVVERRLVLKEELHVRRRQTQVRQPQRVMLRAERAEIKRLPSQAQR